MPQYRVGSGGLRVIHRDGSESQLPAGCVIDELPERYEGKLDVIEFKQVHGYADKQIRPAEDKRS